FTDSGGGTAGGSGGGHFVTITDYDKETGIAKMQNQWGPDSTHEISAKDIYQATKPPASRISDLQAEVDANRNDWFKTIDYSKEHELLRLKKNEGKISDAEYDNKIVELSVERFKKWQKDGGDPKDPKYNKETKEVMQMLAEIEKSDPERAKKISEEVK